MINKKFKIGDKVKFTQKAKDRFADSLYWHFANYSNLESGGGLDKTYTVLSVGSNDRWPKVFLGEGTAPYTPTFLLEPAEIQKNKNMQKKDFILALIQAIFPDCKFIPTYSSCCPNVKVHTGTTTIVVKYSKNPDNVRLALSPVDGIFRETDIELVTKFLDKQCDLCCLEDNIKITDDGDLVMYFDDYPWHLVDEIKPLEQSPTKEEIQALQAEIQRLKAENEQLKAQTYTIEIPKGITSICLNLKG